MLERKKVDNKKREKKLKVSASKEQKAMTIEINNLKAKVSIEELFNEFVFSHER